MRRARKGLSPLVAAVVLISATIVGGMLVYQYFQNSLGKAQAMAEGISASADSIPLSNGRYLIHVTVVNNYDQPIQVTSATGITDSGNEVSLTPTNQTTLPVTVNPGDKTTIIFIVDQHITAVSVEYQMNGNTYVSEPAPVG